MTRISHIYSFYLLTRALGSPGEPLSWASSSTGIFKGGLPRKEAMGSLEAAGATCSFVWAVGPLHTHPTQAAGGAEAWGVKGSPRSPRPECGATPHTRVWTQEVPLLTPRSTSPSRSWAAPRTLQGGGGQEGTTSGPGNLRNLRRQQKRTSSDLLGGFP